LGRALLAVEAARASSVNRHGTVRLVGLRAWLVEFQHVGAVQELHAGSSEPVDAALERRMLGLSSVDNGNATTGRCLPIASVKRPSARVSLMPAAHLLIVLKVAGATTMASGGGSTSGCLYSERTGCPEAASKAGRHELMPLRGHSHISTKGITTLAHIRRRH
jgi:hypothetical protein